MTTIRTDDFQPNKINPIIYFNLLPEVISFHKPVINNNVVKLPSFIFGKTFKHIQILGELFRSLTETQNLTFSSDFSRFFE